MLSASLIDSVYDIEPLLAYRFFSCCFFGIGNCIQGYYHKALGDVYDNSRDDGQTKIPDYRGMIMLFSKMIEVNDEINAEMTLPRKGPVIALVGNPNVGKSTVFNALTGMKQHTGNWPGKTVELATGTYEYNHLRHEMVDLPGTYSLLAHSSEEEVTRNFICFEECDVCTVICDSTCLERNLNLVLQTLEITNKVVVVLNLHDEAQKKGIQIDQEQLQKQLGCDVVTMSARNNVGFDDLKAAIQRTAKKKFQEELVPVRYDMRVEYMVQEIIDAMGDMPFNRRFYALKLLDHQVDAEAFYQQMGKKAENVRAVVTQCHEKLAHMGIDQRYEEMIVHAINSKAKRISEDCIIFNNADYYQRNMKIDRIVTSRRSGVLIMLALLAVIFWITIEGANVPSQMLSDMFGNLEAWLNQLASSISMPVFWQGLLIDGVYKTLAWVVSVMLPPMAIFFPMFTILEDLGYLPRIAFNLDGYFQKACACGKQALTMCMGFGCNAVGVSGCRIIDSPRERLIALLTNNFVPCNGRFPTLIAIITMFFSGMLAAPWNGLMSTLLLTGVILFGILLTFWTSSFLSKTILKGVPSSFTLELPPYRKPQFGKVIVRSIFDRTLFVLGRAVSVAIPAGAIIWLLANIQVDGITLLAHISAFLDPLGHLMGLDGVILLAFILGFPANEIVVPIIIMSYMASGYMMDMQNLSALKELLLNNGWTWITAVCTMLFSLVHFPCATTLLTIRKETKSWKWTALSFLLPTIMGIVLCIIVSSACHLLVALF